MMGSATTQRIGETPSALPVLVRIATLLVVVLLLHGNANVAVSGEQAPTLPALPTGCVVNTGSGAGTVRWICNALNLTTVDYAWTPGTTHIQLFGNRLTVFDSARIAPLLPLLFDLNIHNNAIATASFVGLNLRAIYMSSNALTRVPADMFGSLINLTSLDLDRNQISIVEPHAFDNLTQLVVLQMESNGGLRDLHPTFARLTSLHTLLLAHNTISAVRGSIFGAMTLLTSLTLCCNDIALYEEGVFRNLTRVRTLTLHRNPLDFMPAPNQTGTVLFPITPEHFNGSNVTAARSCSTAVDTPAFTETTLTNCCTYQCCLPVQGPVQVPCVPPRPPCPFTELPNGDVVWNCFGMAVPIRSTSYFWGATTSAILLNDNAVTSVAPNSLSNLARLTSVNLARNQLARITVDGLRGLASVEQLHLIGNNITYIEPLAFSNMTSLVLLRINNNLITRIDATTLVGLDRLESFSAAFNRITLIEPTTFDSMSMLTRLVLDGNSIVHVVAPDPGSGRLWRAVGPTLTSCRLSSNNITLISMDSFASAVMLGDLELSFNHITLIRDGAFANTTRLTVLRLRYNSIASVDHNTLTGLTRLEHLDLQNNVITTVPTGTFFHLSALRLLELESNLLTRFQSLISVDGAQGPTALETIDLRNNTITLIGPSAFSGLSNLTQLRMDLNLLSTIQQDTFLRIASTVSLNLAQNALTMVHRLAFDDFVSARDLTNNPLAFVLSSTVPTGCSGTAASDFFVTDTRFWCCIGENRTTCESAPTFMPTSGPTGSPTASPSSRSPTAPPTPVPTALPVSAPSTAQPTSVPTASVAAPSASPTASPSVLPTAAPSATPTSTPSAPTTIQAGSPTPATLSPTSQLLGGGGGNGDGSSSSLSLVLILIGVGVVAVFLVGCILVYRRSRADVTNRTVLSSVNGPLQHTTTDMFINPLHTHTRYLVPVADTDASSSSTDTVAVEGHAPVPRVTTLDADLYVAHADGTPPSPACAVPTPEYSEATVISGDSTYAVFKSPPPPPGPGLAPTSNEYSLFRDANVPPSSPARAVTHPGYSEATAIGGDSAGTVYQSPPPALAPGPAPTSAEYSLFRDATVPSSSPSMAEYAVPTGAYAVPTAADDAARV